MHKIVRRTVQWVSFVNMAISTVAHYLATLPADRRVALSAVRKVINENLPTGY